MMRPIAKAWCMEQSLNPRRVPQGPRRLFRQCVIALLVLATTHEQTRAQAAASPAYDVVIRGGRVLDGAGNPWINADAAIRDGRFVRICVVRERGSVELDARGKFVSPGWIDVMDHSGRVLRRNPLAENKFLMGVTSAIAGEGGTPVGASAIAQYFEQLERQGISIDFGSYFSESWAQEGGADSLRARLANPEIRARLKREQQTGSPGWWNIVETSGGWDRIVLANARNPESAKYAGKSLEQIGREMGKDPADAAFDLVLQGKGRVMAIDHVMSEPDIETALPGSGDDLGLPHPRAYGNLVRVIAEYVRKWHVLTLEDAVRKMTSWPATRYRLASRGIIKEGNWADVTVFDLATLDDRATYEHPTLIPTGIEWVLVNGVVTIDHGTQTGAKAGKVLYGPGREAPSSAP